MFQTRAVPSLPAVASRRESRLKATSKMRLSSAPRNTWRCRPAPSQRTASPSAPAVAIRSPFGLNAARSTRAGCGSLARSRPSRRIRLAPRRPATTKRLRPGRPRVACAGRHRNGRDDVPSGSRRTVSRVPRSVRRVPAGEPGLRAAPRGDDLAADCAAVDEPDASVRRHRGERAAGQGGEITHRRLEACDRADPRLPQRAPGTSSVDAEGARRAAGAASASPRSGFGLALQIALASSSRALASVRRPPRPRPAPARRSVARAPRARAPPSQRTRRGQRGDRGDAPVTAARRRARARARARPRAGRATRGWPARARRGRSRSAAGRRRAPGTRRRIRAASRRASTGSRRAGSSSA